MDKTTLVIEGLEDGAILVDGVDKLMGVTVAFWADDHHEDDWGLYIASDRVDDKTRRALSIEIYQLADELDILVCEADYKLNLISSDEPIAKAAKAAQDVPRRRLRPRDILFPNPRHHGSESRVSVYIYPALVKTS